MTDPWTEKITTQQIYAVAMEKYAGLDDNTDLIKAEFDSLMDDALARGTLLSDDPRDTRTFELARQISGAMVELELLSAEVAAGRKELKLQMIPLIAKVGAMRAEFCELLGIEDIDE